MTLSERAAQIIGIVRFSGVARQLSQLRRVVGAEAGGVSVDRDGGRPPHRARFPHLPCPQALFANSCGLVVVGQGNDAQTLHRLHGGRGGASRCPVAQSADARPGSGA